MVDHPNKMFTLSETEKLVADTLTFHKIPYTKKLEILSQNQKKAYTYLVNEHNLSECVSKAIVGVLTGESLMNPADFHWDNKHFAQGIASWSDERSEKIKTQFGKYPVYMTVEEQCKAILWEINTNKAFKLVKDSLTTGEPFDVLHNMIAHFEIPGNVNGQIVVRSAFYASLIPQNLLLA